MSSGYQEGGPPQRRGRSSRPPHATPDHYNHKCPILTCSLRVPAQMLMCPKHWSMVPVDQKRAVYDAWGNGHPTPEYMTIRSTAIDAVEARLLAVAAKKGQPPA
jgi:hypothetical protein